MTTDLTRFATRVVGKALATPSLMDELRRAGAEDHLIVPAHHRECIRDVLARAYHGLPHIVLVVVSDDETFEVRYLECGRTQGENPTADDYMGLLGSSRQTVAEFLSQSRVGAETEGQIRELASLT